MAENNLKITYKGQDIVNASIESEVTKTIKTSGKYCEGDIVVKAQGGSGGGGSDKFGYTSEDDVLQFEKNIVINKPNVTEIAPYTFYYGWYNKTPVTDLPSEFVLPNLTTVGNYALYYAFRGDTNLTQIDISKVNSIGSYGMYYAFYGCTGIAGDLTLILNTLATYGLAYAFYDTEIDRILIKVDESKDTTFSTTYGMSYAFYSTPIKYANVQTGWNSYCFQYALASCTQLEYATIKACFSGSSASITYGSYALTYVCSGDTALRYAETLPHDTISTRRGTTSTANYFAQRAFSGCTNLKRVDMTTVAMTQQAYSYVCFNCQNLERFSNRIIDRPESNVSNNTPNVTALFYIGFGHDTSHAPTTLPDVVLYDVSSMGAATSTTVTTALFGGTSANRVEMNALYLPHYRTEQTGAGKNNWFNQYSTCNELHFSKGYENQIKALSGYATLWGLGAGGATVYFDLVSEIFPTNDSSHPYIKRAQFDTCAEITYNGTTYARNQALDYWGGQFRAYTNGNDTVYIPCEYPRQGDDVLSFNTTTGDYTRLGAISSTKTYYCWTHYAGANNYTQRFTLKETPDVGDDVYQKNADGTFVLLTTVNAVK